ncbi:hypothetical protein Tco_0884200 [Tanacetum coccineum]
MIFYDCDALVSYCDAPVIHTPCDELVCRLGVADVKKNIETVQGTYVYPAAQQMLIHQVEPVKPIVVEVVEKSLEFVIRCLESTVGDELSFIQAVQLSKFDYRLSNKLETNLQKIRCRVNYQALKFTDPINKMGQKLVNRMRKMGRHYVALHLR